MYNQITKITALLDKLDDKSALWVCIFLSLTVGMIDTIFNLEERNISLDLFYLIPIVLAAWRLKTIEFIGITFMTAAFNVNDHIDAFIFHWEKFNNDHTHNIIYHMSLITWDILITATSLILAGVFIRHLRLNLMRERAMAKIDDLTEICNKPAFDSLINIELNRIKRRFSPFTIAIIDIDSFKVHNEKYGSTSGDNALQLIANEFKRSLRKTDSVGRFDGDEFIIMLIDTSYNGTLTVMSKLKNRLDRLMNENGWDITFSIGAMVFKTPPLDLEEAIKLVNDVVLEVKGSGKNNIVVKVYLKKPNGA